MAGSDQDQAKRQIREAERRLDLYRQIVIGVVLCLLYFFTGFYWTLNIIGFAILIALPALLIRQLCRDWIARRRANGTIQRIP